MGHEFNSSNRADVYAKKFPILVTEYELTYLEVHGVEFRDSTRCV